jgi:hypothetical protein
MILHNSDLAWAFIAAIVASCSFALAVISMLFLRVMAEARRSDQDEKHLFVFLQEANIVLNQYYSKQTHGDEQNKDR